jgi:GTP-binding protein HflX
VLKKLEALDKPTLVVLNKLDLIEEPSTRLVLRSEFPGAVFVSLRTGEGLDELIEKIGDFVAADLLRMEVLLPLERTDLLARIYRDGTVHELSYLEEGISLQATLPPRLRQAVAEFARN